MGALGSERDDFVFQMLINILVLLFFSVIPIIFKFSNYLFFLYLLFLIYFLSIIVFKNKGRLDPLINQITLILSTFVVLGVYFALKAKTINSSTALLMIELSIIVLIILIIINRTWQVNNFLKRGLLLQYLSLRKSILYYIGNILGFLILILFFLLTTFSESYPNSLSGLMGESFGIILHNTVDSLLVLGISILLIIFANSIIAPQRPRLPPDFIRPSVYELSGTTLTDLFSALSQVFVSEKSNHWNGIIQFIVLGQSIQFAAYIQNETCQIKMEHILHPDITITAWENTFLALLIGKLEPVHAFLNGYLKVDKPHLLMKYMIMFNFQSLPSIVRNNKNSA